MRYDFTKSRLRCFGNRHNMHLIQISMGCILAVACLAIQPSFAQVVPGTVTRFVVTSPVFPPVTPNMGILSAPFMVRRFRGKNEVTVPFLAFSSNRRARYKLFSLLRRQAVGSIRHPDTSGGLPRHRKIVRGRYAFVLTVHYQKLQGPTNEPEGISEPRDAVAVDCNAQTSATFPDVHAVVNVTVSGTGGISANPSIVSLSFNADPAMQFLKQDVTIDYTAPQCPNALGCDQLSRDCPGLATRGLLAKPDHRLRGGVADGWILYAQGHGGPVQADRRCCRHAVHHYRADPV